MADQEQALKDELAAVSAELVALQHEQEIRNRELESRNATIAKLEKALADKEGESASIKSSLAATESRLAEVSQALAQAVAEYKALVIEANPDVPAELVTGATIAEVNESLKNAQALVERVKRTLESEAARTRIPAGAPQRAPLDLSALSPREKIQYAMGGSSS